MVRVVESSSADRSPLLVEAYHRIRDGEASTSNAGIQISKFDLYFPLNCVLTRIAFYSIQPKTFEQT